MMVRDTRGSTLKPMRFCNLCNLMRTPSRSSHCYNCKVCVIGFDHHCIWLGTCIGARNYLDFIFFLISLISLIVYTEFSLWREIVEVNSL